MNPQEQLMQALAKRAVARTAGDMVAGLIFMFTLVFVSPLLWGVIADDLAAAGQGWATMLSYWERVAACLLFVLWAPYVGRIFRGAR